MPYRFSTERVDYSDFASGRVFHSLPGRTAFPVRLADELFQRCQARRPAAVRDHPVVLYDPCCGGASLLCSLALLHWTSIAQIVASDADQEAVALATRNLALLTPHGLAERRLELTALHAKYGRASHAEALASLDRLAARVRDLSHDHPLPTQLFQANALNETDLTAHLEPESIDVAIADVPYDQHSRWLVDRGQGATPDPSGPPPVWQLLDTIRPFLAVDAVVAIVSDKSQRARHERYVPAGTFQIGKRRVSLLTLA